MIIDSKKVQLIASLLVTMGVGYFVYVMYKDLLELKNEVNTLNKKINVLQNSEKNDKSIVDNTLPESEHIDWDDVNSNLSNVSYDSEEDKEEYSLEEQNTNNSEQQSEQDLDENYLISKYEEQNDQQDAYQNNPASSITELLYDVLNSVENETMPTISELPELSETPQLLDDNICTFRSGKKGKGKKCQNKCQDFSKYCEIHNK